MLIFKGLATWSVGIVSDVIVVVLVAPVSLTALQYKADFCFLVLTLLPVVKFFRVVDLDNVVLCKLLFMLSS